MVLRDLYRSMGKNRIRSFSSGTTAIRKPLRLKLLTWMLTLPLLTP